MDPELLAVKVFYSDLGIVIHIVSPSRRDSFLFRRRSATLPLIPLITPPQPNPTQPEKPLLRIYVAQLSERRLEGLQVIPHSPHTVSN